MMFQKGQTVYMEAGRYGRRDEPKKIEEGVITVVGRTYYTVKAGWNEYRFYKDTLRQKSDYGYERTMYASEQEIYEDRERLELYAQLHAEFGKYDGDLSLAQLRRIMAIIDEGNGILHEDGTYDCAAYDTPRDFDWCEQNCQKYYGCDTVLWANDERKEREGDE